MALEKTIAELNSRIREGRYEEASAILDKEGSSHPDSLELSYYRGTLDILENKTEEGRKRLLEVAEEARERSNLIYGVGAAARVVHLDPLDVDVRIKRAELYLSAGLQAAAYQYLLRSFAYYKSRNQAQSLERVVQMMLSVDEANLDLALKMAKILARLDLKDEVQRIVENAMFTLQGQGNYQEAAEVQSEYTKLYEEE